MALGVRLRWVGDGTDRFSWQDLSVFLRTSQGEALSRFRDPDGHDWDTNTYLLAGIFDALMGANWQRAGGKGKRPEPISRPGDRVVEVESVEPVEDRIPSTDESGVYRGEATPIDELADWLGWA